MLQGSGLSDNGICGIFLINPLSSISSIKSRTISLTDKMTFYVLSSSTDTRDNYSVGFLIDNSLIGYMIVNMGWVHVRYEVDTTGVRTYIKYGSNEWWRFS